MSVLGTEFKINVHVEPMDGYHMSDYDFDCSFFVLPNKRVEINKAGMKEIDSDNYIAIITSSMASILGRGTVKMRISAKIPDADFPDGTRTEIAEVCTNVVIM